MNKILILTLLSIFFHLNLRGQSPKQFETQEIKDLLYVEKSSVENDSLQRLHLVLPKGLKDYPLLIWIGGGAWSYVDRNVEMDVARTFASEGIAVASVGHRLSSAVWRDPSLSEGIQHPKHIEDIAAAVKYLYHKAEDYGFDKEKIFIGGFSSGAHLAALLSMDTRYLEQVGLSTKIIKGVIPISGTYDVVNYFEVFKNGSSPHLAKEHVQAVFGESQEAMIDASPTHYLAKLSTPMLLMSDNGISRYTKLFEEKIRETNFNQFTVMYAWNLSHGDLWRDIWQNKHSLYRAAMRNFMWAQVE